MKTIEQRVAEIAEAACVICKTTNLRISFDVVAQEETPYCTLTVHQTPIYFESTEEYNSKLRCQTLQSLDENGLSLIEEKMQGFAGECFKNFDTAYELALAYSWYYLGCKNQELIDHALSKINDTDSKGRAFLRIYQSFKLII